MLLLSDFRAKEMFKLAPSLGTSRGVYCGGEGLYLGPVALIEKSEGTYRLMDEKYGPGNWRRRSREYRKLHKYGDRSFRDPGWIILPDEET